MPKLAAGCPGRISSLGTTCRLLRRPLAALILHISYKDHVTNEEVRAKSQQAIGPHEELLTTVERRKLQWYGHVSRSSGLAKTILQGTVKGERRQGRQRRRWEDNIRKRTGLELRTGKNGENWLQNHLWCSIDPRG